MELDEQRFTEIAARIHSDTSPVGIDAQKTHVIIIHLLEELTARVTALEQRLAERDG